ncbi:MAG: hypothetical protein JKY19_03420 [Alcanivoracaceae bacterium]|nr:hypothetical protein [Alcanivoracaceae bacterium]
MKILLIYLLCLFIQINSSGAKTHEVLVSSNVFTPNSLVIEAGDTVRWRNTGGGHNVFASNGSFRCAEGCESEGGNGDPSTIFWVSEVTFREVGTTAYICQPHVGFGMVGSITVIEPQSVTVHEVHATTSNGFEPDDLTIQRGDVVRFINDGGAHNINAVDNSLICSEACEGDGTNFDSNPTGFPWDIYVRFDQVADIPYFCANHESTGTGGIIRVLTDTLFSNSFE